MLDLITDFDHLASIQREWDGLWHQVPSAKYCQSYTYCRNSWFTMARAQRGTLACFVGRHEGAIVFIWPLVTYLRFFWKIAKPLGPEAPAPVGPLMREGFPHYLAEAWDYLRGNRLADVLSLDYVNLDSDLNRVVIKNAIVDARPDVAPYAARCGRDWSAYARGLSHSHRKKHSNMQRRLAEQGGLDFEIVEAGDERCEALIVSLLAHKRHWADKVNKRGDWLYTPLYEIWLKRLYAERSSAVKYVIFVLSVSGVPIAIKLAALCKHHVDLIIAGFDASYDKFSPGMRLDEYWIRWAFEKRFDVDFGLGADHYKMFWTQGNAYATLTCNIAANKWGWLGVMILRLKRRIIR